MEAVKLPARHEIVFSMSEASMAKTQALMEKCGHTNLNLLLARGLALAEWVQDQMARGRMVGSLDDNGEGFWELHERPELLAPSKPAPLAIAPVAVEQTLEPGFSEDYDPTRKATLEEVRASLATITGKAV